MNYIIFCEGGDQCIVTLDSFCPHCGSLYSQHLYDPKVVCMGEKVALSTLRKHMLRVARHGLISFFSLASLGNKGQSHVLKPEGNAAF